MHDSCEEYQVLITGYVDNELADGDRERLEAHVKACSACRRELEHTRRIVQGTSAALAVDEVPQEVWDTFLDNVYNRVERQTGWILVILGAIALASFGIVLFEMAPNISPLTKVLITVPAVGLFILFLSVLRQRMRAAKTDRYSKEILR